MSVFHSFELLDPYSYALYREPVFLRPRLSSFHSPLAHAVVSAEEFIDFEFDILYPSSIPVYLPRSCCIHRHFHYHHHQCHPFPLSIPFADFFDAAAGLIFHKRAGAEPYVRSIDDRLATLQFGNDRDICPCIGVSESKWKGAAEIKGKMGVGFNLKYNVTAEENGAFKKSMRWVIEYHGNGKFAPLSRMYTFRAALVSTQAVCEKAKKEEEVKRAMSGSMEIDEETDQQVVSNIKASAKRTVHGRKGKKKEQSPQDAAMAIQKTFRDYLLRRSQVIHSLRDLAVAKSKLKEIRLLYSKFSYRYRLSKDAEERQRFSEKIIFLLLTIDAVEGHDLMVRSAKRSMSRELEAVLMVVDPQPYERLKFDPPVGSLATEIASGVSDVIRMLDQEDGGTHRLLAQLVDELGWELPRPRSNPLQGGGAYT